ncbi:hypothetical protein C8T65DRAFT_248302 [Cerioporus squamosus]|nr:hypothetical protein C8T65DRAFT_248302 [Cerioporus squamosus]
MAVVTPRVPPELVDQIIAHVGDGATLLNCCLVCSSWLPASRHCLFHIIRINHPDTSNLLVSRVLQSDRLRPYLASVFELHFSGTKLPPTGILVRGDLIPSADPRTHVKFIQEFVGHMPNLACLTMNNSNWEKCPPHPSTFLMFSQFPGIRELRFRMCHFPSWSTLRRMLASLPSLTTLELTDVSWPHTSVHLPSLSSYDGGRKPLHTCLSSLTPSHSSFARIFGSFS